MTFISAPAIVFATNGNLTYLQLALGAILARVIIGIWFVPAYYRREIYSPYDYVGQRLGESARQATTLLFMLGAILGQSVRVLLTAIVLQTISGFSLTLSIWIIGAVAITWTLLGGISTVIWTDVIQFFVFLGGLTLVLFLIMAELPGGWGQIWSTAAAAGKLRLWDLSLDPSRTFTLWTGIIANTIFCLHAYGTDQLIAQRMFCCRGPREARIAIIVSSVSQFITVLALLVGLALYALYQHRPLTGDAAALVAEQPDRVLPVYLVRNVPPVLLGLIIAGVFAAAISSLDSVLAALTQTTVSSLHEPLRRLRRAQAGANAPHAGSNATASDADDRWQVGVSRLFVIAWGIVLCLMAHLAIVAWRHYGDILNLALAMASYVGGPLLAAFLLAFFRAGDTARGVVWGAPLAVLVVFSVTWHAPWAQVTSITLAAGLLALWFILERRRLAGFSRPRAVGESIIIGFFAAAAIFLSTFDGWPGGAYAMLAWPWNVPLGLTVSLAVGLALGRPGGAEGKDPASPVDSPEIEAVLTDR